MEIFINLLIISIAFVCFAMNALEGYRYWKSGNINDFFKAMLFTLAFLIIGVVAIGVSFGW